MELKLNIYEGSKITKTYSVNDFVLSTGTCEDILNLVDVDKFFSGNLTEEQKGVEIIKTVRTSFSVFRPFFQDIFVGLTDEEFRKTSIKEVGKIVIQIIKYTISELYSVGGTTKN